MLSHGLSLNHTFMISYAKKLQKMKINAILFDFHGGGYDTLSSGRIEDMSLITEIDDLNNVIDYVKTWDFINPDKIYLAGHSQGGFISSIVAPKRCDINAIFLFAPAYVILDDVENTENMRPKNVLRLMDELGDKYINDAKKIKLPDDIQGYTGNVLIFHGKLDERVPVKYAYEAFNTYNDDNCELIIFDDEEHRFTDKTKDIVVEKIKEKIDMISNIK
nr:YqiA/YcfP family alpha/beta fold hydrolase [Methanosphaera cuniculi]